MSLMWWRAVVVAAIVCAGAMPATAQDLRVHGSNTVGEHLAPALIEAWLDHRGLEAPVAEEIAAGERTFRSAALSVRLHTHGSNAGLRDLLDGRTDIAMSSRPVFPQEVEQARGAGLGNLLAVNQEFVIALDGVAVIVHPDNPLREIDLRNLRRIFAGELTDWSRLGAAAGPIRVHARDDRSGTFETFRMLVLHESTLTRRAQRHESTDALARAVAADPGAIGFVGLGGIGSARAIAVRDEGTEALMPTPDAVAVEDYLLARRLYLYLCDDASVLAREFAEFAIGDAAQAVVRQSGFVTQAIRAVSSTAPSSAPELYGRLTDGAQRLSVNFRFGSGTSVLDSRAQRDMQRLTRFLADERLVGRVFLIGFADASEVLPYLAVTLANDRADFVAAQLLRHGVDVAAAHGIGGHLPVASNRHDWGRHKNRRVEVWLRTPAG